MLTRTEMDDLRFVRDCLHTCGDKASETFTRRLLLMNPRLEGMVPMDQAGRRSFLAAAFDRLLMVQERPAEHQAWIRQLGQDAAGRGIDHQAFRDTASELALTVQEHLGTAFNPRLRETCLRAFFLAATPFQEGLIESEREMEGHQLAV